MQWPDVMGDTMVGTMGSTMVVAIGDAMGGWNNAHNGRCNGCHNGGNTIGVAMVGTMGNSKVLRHPLRDRFQGINRLCNGWCDVHGAHC